MIKYLEDKASRANGIGCGYAFFRSIRVKHTEKGFQYFVNHIETNPEYAEWFESVVWSLQNN